MAVAPISTQTAAVATPSTTATTGLSFAQLLRIFSSQKAIGARKNAPAITHANGAEAIDDFVDLFGNATPLPLAPIDYLLTASAQDFADKLTQFASDYNGNSRQSLHAALRSAVRLLIANPQSHAATELLVRALANREAVQDVQALETIAPNPDFAHYHSMFALLFMAAKRPHEAHTELTRAIAAGEEHARECQTILAAFELDGIREGVGGWCCAAVFANCNLVNKRRK
ncbi:hypothetical protein AGMMS50229_20450 [Campylobacterota bacterium]|nr:hypothetical protein AGMMS50229_20450 [Campylobacterota bacterium]